MTNQNRYRTQLWVGLITSLGLSAVFMNSLITEIANERRIGDMIATASLSIVLVAFALTLGWGLYQDSRTRRTRS